MSFPLTHWEEKQELEALVESIDKACRHVVSLLGLVQTGTTPILYNICAV